MYIKKNRFSKKIRNILLSAMVVCESDKGHFEALENMDFFLWKLPNFHSFLNTIMTFFNEIVSKLVVFFWHFLCNPSDYFLKIPDACVCIISDPRRIFMQQNNKNHHSQYILHQQCTYGHKDIYLKGHWIIDTSFCYYSINIIFFDKL